MDPNKLNRRVIVDSGTTDTYLNKQVMKELKRAGRRRPVRRILTMRLTDEELRSLAYDPIQCDAYTKPSTSIESMLLCPVMLVKRARKRTKTPTTFLSIR
jgi:hypothetical protein